MPNIPLHTVRYLTLAEVAELWAKEVDVPESIMLRELRLGVVNIKRFEKGEEILEALPSEEELPQPDELVDQFFLGEFLKKQDGWYEPKFWQHKKEIPTRSPGRPSLKETIITVFDERKANGKTAKTITAECRAIISELNNRPLEGKIPQTEAVRQMIHCHFYSDGS